MIIKRRNRNKIIQPIVCGQPHELAGSVKAAPGHKGTDVYKRQGVGIGKTYAYLTACILLKKFAPHGPTGSQPVVVSTSSVPLQHAIIGEYIPFLSRIFLENRIIQKPIRAIVRKGKERFVCDVRLFQRLEAVKDKKKNAEQLNLSLIHIS